MEDCIAVYSRKSKFTGKGESIGNQVELSREYIRTHYGDAYAESMVVYTIRLIYKIFQESDSLTHTEAELMKRGIKTKNGKYHTRFSIKSILQNTVYVIADDKVYNHLVNKDADLFSDKAAFDGVHGLMVYNRTDQEKGVPQGTCCRKNGSYRWESIPVLFPAGSGYGYRNPCSAISRKPTASRAAMKRC